MIFTPHEYQVTARDFIHAVRRGALFMDCGTGKTVICLDAISRERSMLPALVVAPLRCVTNVWPCEIDKWDFDLSYSVCHGKDRYERLLERSDVKVTNYESLEWLFLILNRKGKNPFKTVIFDEASRLKSATSKRTNFAQAIAERIENRILLTGTPIPAGYHDLWSQVFILDRGKTFGTYDNFISKAFDLDHFNRPVLKFGWGGRIETKIKPFSFRGDANELLDMPELIESTIRIELSEKVMERYGEVEYGFLNGLEDYDAHTEANYAPMRCCASGFLYHTDLISGSRQREDLHTQKLDVIDEIWNENNRKPLLLVFNFRGEREMLTRKFNCPFIDGSVNSVAGDALVGRWNAGSLPMLAVQPLSVGFGLNMQSGGRHMVWMSLPDSGEIYTQTVARLHRQGQSGTVYVYRIVAKDTIEESIERLLRKKILTQANLLNAMRFERVEK